MDKIGFIGGGNMAEALIKGILSAELYKGENVIVSDLRQDRLDYLVKTYQVVTEKENSILAENVDILVLSVKPQNFPEVLEEIKSSVKASSLVISIAAGKTLANISAILGDLPMVRVMPNTPALIGQGASALFANDKAKPMLEKALGIFSSVGIAVVVENEDLIDAVTAVSGSGPAYYFLLIEEMINAAVELNLSPDTAKKLVLATAKGAAMLAVEADRENQSPAELRRKVTSPGGTTEAALKVFEQGNFGSVVSAAIKQAHSKSRELSG